jgi:electron transport complex protein RnfC
MSQILHPFRGGIKLDSYKEVTRNKTSRSIAVPETLYLPLQQHVGMAAKACVEEGQLVVADQVIAESPGSVGMRLHAPIAGMIGSIVNFPVIHNSGQSASCIEIFPDSRIAPVKPCGVVTGSTLENKSVYERIEQAGIVGLGGAGFPAHIKVREGVGQTVDTLIINGVECEPHITCDDRLMQENSAEVIAGSALVAQAIDAARCVVAVESDMEAAFSALSNVLAEPIELVSVPAIYPAGSEKQLTAMVTGQEIPSGLLPIDVGVAVLNVATVVAIYRAVTRGQPLTERLVTVTGSVQDPGNLRVLIGTPVQHVLEQFGDFDRRTHKVLSGGPMMGTEILDTQAPITKTTNCLLVVEREQNDIAESACIRCGDCLPVCPIGLQPQQLFEASRRSDVDTAQDLHLFDCIECGCCTYVCPSRIPLVDYFRYAKSSIESLDRDRAQADRARERFTRREDRLAGSKWASPRSDDVVLADVRGVETATLQSDVQAAVARARRRRDQQTSE